MIVALTFDIEITGTWNDVFGKFVFQRIVLFVSRILGIGAVEFEILLSHKLFGFRSYLIFLHRRIL